MIIQDDPEVLNWANAMTAPRAPKIGSFLQHVIDAAYHADWENYPIIRPALLQLKEKYPADPTRLAMEEEDNAIPEH